MTTSLRRNRTAWQPYLIRMTAKRLSLLALLLGVALATCVERGVPARSAPVTDAAPARLY